MENENTKYFNFPVQLMEGFMVNSRESLNNIFDYALYVQAISYYEKEGYEWTIHQDEETILDLAKSFFNLNDIEIGIHDFIRGKELHDSLPEKSPKTRINVDVWFDYYYNPKESFQKVCLLCHMAILSTNKTRPYSRVDKFFIYSRMDGKIRSVLSDYKDLNLKFPDPEPLKALSDEVRKYATHRYWEKIRKELVNNWYWTIPKRIPRMNDKGLLEVKQIRGSNYYTQLNEESFFKIIISEEEKKYKKRMEENKPLENIIDQYNTKKCLAKC